MDPALIGVVGTSTGAIIGYLGTVTTAWLTRKREDRARSYSERKTAYAETLTHLDEAWSRILIRGQDRNFMSEKSTYDGIGEYRKMSATLSLIAPDEVRDLARDASVFLIEPHPERALSRERDFWNARRALANAMRTDLEN